MPTLIVSGVEYAHFFDDLRAVIRHELKQTLPAQPSEDLLIQVAAQQTSPKGKRSRKEVKREA